MKVKITKEYKYAPDGVGVITCQPGDHDLPEKYAKDAKNRGFAGAKAKATPKNKAVKSAPKNKSK